ncbi:glutathione S-transferase [Parasphingorhabdus marina DSM 22363]|uniref:Glutathione S-transferase n=1 Tax=Parasphingorhabdus marina DSM 22363 TaxID=1123272 RepID=A0A1N6HHT4_9SPHN|nr:glutathione S-transferase family protein [Parasphingorhabdus marina]SIO19287.1 glutathione S-transferase [Parasphingorhabdus marina DSM 22363]
MITLHHLEYSRSTRIIWLLEELGVEYEMVRHQRHPETMRAQADLAAIHPLAKAPTAIIDGNLMMESGAIIEYILEQYGEGKLAPAPGSNDRAEFLEWLHFAEGTLANPVIVQMLAPRFGGLGEGYAPFVEGEVVKLLDYVEHHLDNREYIVGDSFSGADINIMYVIELAMAAGMLANRPACADYGKRMMARDGYRKAIELGGPVVPSLGG